jgi:pimeloyl-ACP methyl ester carboxylesterase
MGTISPRMVRVALRRANVTPIPEAQLQEIYAKLDFGTQRAILKLHRSVKAGTLAAAGAELGAIEAPALVIWGEADPFIPALFAGEYAEALGGPCELLALEDAGHWPWLDRPDVIERVAAFLAPDSAAR